MYVEFYDGADAVVGRYFVRRHTGAYGAYDCDRIIEEYQREHPELFVGCEQVTGTSSGWTRHSLMLDETFFANLSGPTPGPIAAIKVVIESYNNAGSGADAYFDNIRYDLLIPVGG